MNSNQGRSPRWYLMALLALLVATAARVGARSEMSTNNTAVQDLIRLESPTYSLRGPQILIEYGEYSRVAAF
jgi:hypothetical protein